MFGWGLRAAPAGFQSALRMLGMKDLSKIFKAYDIRGVHPTEFDEEAARRIGGPSLAS